MDHRSEREQLCLRVSYKNVPRAAEAAATIAGVPAAWADMPAIDGLWSVEDLLLAHVEIASLSAWFEVGAAVAKIYEQRLLFTEFVDMALGYVTTSVSGGELSIPRGMAKMLRGMAHPVINADAVDATLSISGDNENILIIDQSNAQALIDAINRSTAALDRVAESLKRYDGDDRDCSKDRDPVESEDGCLYYVANSWYFSIPSFNGLLVPAQGVGRKIKKDRRHYATGSTRMLNGIPIEFRVSRIW